jgi:ribose transport system substrate-binding protein
MRKQRFTVVIILLLILSVFYTAYLMKIFTAAGSEGKTVTVVLKSLNVRSDFWQTVNAGAQVAAKQAGAVIDLAGPLQENDADAQIKALEEAIARKPQAIVVAPYNHERMPEIIQRIRDAGIRLVVIDTPLSIDPKPVFVGNDHQEAGRLAGRKAAEVTGGQPVAAILTDFKYSPISEERKKGVQNALADYPGSLYGTYYAGDSEERAYDIAVSLLRDKPDFNVIVALGQSSTQGAAKAIKDTDNGKKVRLIGFDGSINEIQLLEEGVLNATIVQKPFNMGYLGVKTALDLLDGKTASGTYIDSTVVTRSNMYTPEIQKLLFPFIENH